MICPELQNFRPWGIDNAGKMYEQNAKRKIWAVRHFVPVRMVWGLGDTCRN